MIGANINFTDQCKKKTLGGYHVVMMLGVGGGGGGGGGANYNKF